MGRPLKIAKAQAILTITDTTQATGYVTVSQNLNTLVILRGMQFVTASDVGGLTGGTTYWVLNVIDANNFTVSATSPDSNRTNTAVDLTDTTSQTVAATVGQVDTGFNNPDGSNTATNSTTYGVVGGNTSIYGSQVLANVAFGVQGTGTIFASTSSNVVAGLGTDFANVAAGTILFAQWGNDPNVAMLIGTTTSTAGEHDVAVANTQATGNFVRTSGNAQTLVSGGPVAFSANLGGLVINTTYWITAIANASAFTVSTTPGGTNVTLTNATGTPNAAQQQIVLTADAANAASGVTQQGDPFVQALPEAGYIVRQKGKTKYLVQGGTTGILGVAYTANVANTALTPNTMSIISTDASSSTAYVSTVNDYQSEIFPTQVADGSLTPGSVYTIYNSGNTAWTSYGSASNITGVTFTATSAGGSGTGTAVLNTSNPDVIATFGTAYAANTYGGQPNPIVTINNA